MKSVPVGLYTVAMDTRLCRPHLKRYLQCSAVLLGLSTLCLLWLGVPSIIRDARTPLQNGPLPITKPPPKVAMATDVPALQGVPPQAGADSSGSMGAEEAYAMLPPETQSALPPFVPWSPPDGPGEYGRHFQLQEKLSVTQQEERSRLRALHGFDQFASDRISVRRRLHDPRPPQCRQQQLGALPDASVVMCFYNEAWSVLLRSLHSVLERSPPALIRELILVDDCSDLAHLGEPLEQYVTSLEKVLLVRMTSRQGLVACRVHGASLARGTILVILDSHVECFPGWLEALLARVAVNSTTVAWPVIDTIMSSDFSVHVEQNLKIGGLATPSLSFTWLSVSNFSDPALPLASPTMPGGLFAMDRKFFFKLGAFDPELHLWGGENLELSLKVWMCGGRIELVPCSRVAHVFRWRKQVEEKAPPPWERNTLRVSEVWMDSYKALIQGHPHYFSQRGQIGDVTSRKRLRASLQCQDFRWYHQHVYPQLSSRVFQHFGLVQSTAQSTCLTYQTHVPRLAPCNNTVFTQVWSMEDEGRLVHEGRCLAVLGSALELQSGASATESALWTLTQTQQMRHQRTGLCLEALPDLTLALGPCLSASTNQRWRLIAL